MTKALTGQTPHKEYALGILELCQILDGIDDAAFLVELPKKGIVAANSRASNLTAWTRFDLTTMFLEQVVSWGINADPFFNPQNYDHKHFQVSINTRSKKGIQAQGRTIPIHQNLTLLLLDSAETTEHRHKRGEETNPTFDKIKKLIRASKNSNPATALSKTLEIGSQILGADAMAIYLGNENIPSARRYTVWGKESIFPVEIFASDLNYLLEPTLWTRGQRSIVTLLHQSARTSGLSYLVSCPIGQENASIGVIAAGGYQMPASGDLLNLIKIIGAIVTDVINQNALISNPQKQLKSQDTNLATLVAAKNSIRDGMVLVTQNLTILEINPAAELILGYASNEVKGLDVDSIFVGTDRLIPSLNLALQGVTTPNLGNVQLHRRDGSTFPADIGVVPIQTAEKTISALILLRDESEHEQILVRTQQLEQRALLGEVTAVFAHEVRNPINNISTGLQLMADNLPEDEEQQELIARLQQDCTRLTDLMESVLTFSRTGGYTFLPVDIGNLINRLITRWTPRMIHLNIQSFINIPQGRHMVNGDRRALEQVFTNLISNAVQAMQETEGGTLAIKVSLYPGSSGRSMLQIDVSDTGPGIAEENRQKIFDPFFTTRQNGTGLGLAITKQIVTAHKGSINLTSFPGGTVFHVNIPAISYLEIPS
jgi:two-component system sensor histidine kinase AtoS